MKVILEGTTGDTFAVFYHQDTDEYEFRCLEGPVNIRESKDAIELAMKMAYENPITVEDGDE